MKFNCAFELALSLAPLVVSAAPADGLFNTLINSALGCPIGVKERAQTGAWRAMNNLNLQQTPTIESFCATLRASASKQDARCYSTCETDYASAFASNKEEYDRSVREHQARQERERAAEQVALAKKQAAEIRAADLKAGRVQPDTLEEAALAYGAKPGASLAAGPKIRADGAVYYLYGKIKVAGDAPEFLAATSASETGSCNWKSLHCRVCPARPRPA